MKRKLLLLTAVVCFLVLGNGLRRKDMVESAPPLNAAEMMDLVNQFRAQNGLPPFQYNSALAFAAQRHANWMGSTSIFSHTGDNGSTPQSRATEAGFNGWVSENIVGGSNMSARQGLIWWQNSPIHYNSLVSTRYTHAATGFAVSGNGQNMFVLVVGQPSNSPPSPNSAPDESAAPLIITPIRLAEPAEDGSIVHTLQAGQSLWMVAAYYDADLDYLYQINGRTENDIVQPGDKIYVRLAEGQPPPPTPTPRLSYLVQEGDSAWLIAARHSIELVFFLSLNGIPEDKVLQPGTEVRVRLAAGEDPPPTPTPPVTYKVQEGDSFWSIAAKNDLTVDELLSYNNMTESAFIVPGDELFIRQVDPTPTPTSQPVGTPGAGTGGQTGENTISISNTIPTDFTPAPLVIEAVRSPTPTPTSDPAMIEAMDSANQAMMAEVDADAAVQPNSGGGSIGILIMAISLIGLAALMLYIASRQ